MLGPAAVALAMTFVQSNVVMVAIGGVILVLMIGSLIVLGCQSAGRKRLTSDQARAAMSGQRPSSASVRRVCDR